MSVVSPRHGAGHGARVVHVGLRGIGNIVGGVEKHCSELLPRLVKMGYEAVCVVDEKWKSEENWCGVRVLGVATTQRPGLETFLRVWRSLGVARHLDAAVLHVHSLSAGLFLPRGLRSRSGRRARLVVTLHSRNFEHRKWPLPVRVALRYAYYRCLRYADVLIAVSEHLVPPRHLIRRGRVVVIPNGVTTSLPRRELSRQDIEGRRQRPYVVAVGRLTEEKGTDRLLQVFRECKERVRLLLVGNHGGNKAYQDYITRLIGEDDRVDWSGPRYGADLIRLMEDASAYVSLSRSEGNPISVLEATALGLPLILSDIPGHRDLRCGVRQLVPDNAGSLASALGWILRRDPEDLSEKLNREADCVRAEYSWDVASTTVGRLYDSMLSQAGA